MIAKVIPLTRKPKPPLPGRNDPAVRRIGRDVTLLVVTRYRSLLEERGITAPGKRLSEEQALRFADTVATMLRREASNVRNALYRKRFPAPIVRSGPHDCVPSTNDSLGGGSLLSSLLRRPDISKTYLAESSLRIAGEIGSFSGCRIFSIS